MIHSTELTQMIDPEGDEFWVFKVVILSYVDYIIFDLGNSSVSP